MTSAEKVARVADMIARLCAQFARAGQAGAAARLHQLAESHVWWPGGRRGKRTALRAGVALVRAARSFRRSGQ